MSDSIHLTVATVVCQNGSFLMVREEDNGRTVINQPAGHVEPGETLQEAALRETLEETGWQVALTHFLGLTHYRSPHNGETYYRVTFTASPIAPIEGAELDDSIIEAMWMTSEEIAESKSLRSPMVLADVTKYTENKFYPLDIVSSLSGVMDQ